MNLKIESAFKRRAKFIFKVALAAVFSFAILPMILLFLLFKFTCTEEIFKTVSWPNSHFILSAKCFDCNVTTMPTYTLYLTDKRDYFKRKTAVFSGDRIQHLYACFNGNDLVFSCDIDRERGTTPSVRNKWRHGYGKAEEEKTLNISLKEGTPPGKPYICVLIVKDL